MSKRKNVEPTSNGGTVVGLFKNQIDAERAIERLKREGFSENQIGVAMRDRGQQEQLMEGTGTQAAEGAATGAVSGGVLGGVIGLLAGVGALAIPGVGPIIAGGALASTLAGAGIGAAAGGLLGALMGMGVPEEDARHFDEGFRAGGTLITVNAGSRAEEVRACLYESGADLGSTGRGIQAGAMSTGAAPADRSAGESPVVELRERRPAAGGRETGGTIDEGEEIRIPLMEEEVRVEKTPVVREEVSLKKRQVQDTAQISETVRREEARIEQTGDVDLRESEKTERWRGSERRYRRDSSYTGPERRMAEV